MDQFVRIKEEIRNFIMENFLPEEELADDDPLLESGVIDSTGILEIVSYVQTACGVVFDDEDLVPDNLDSIEKIAAFVVRKLAALETFALAAQN